MLTACGGTEESTTLTESNVTVANGVVDLVQAYMATQDGKAAVGDNQAAQSLAGSESTHRTYALENVSAADIYAKQAGPVIDLTNGGNNAFDSGKTYYVIVDKTSLTSEAKIAEAIEDAIAAMNGSGVHVISKMSVFEATVTNSTNTNVSIDGTTIMTGSEYWVIVFTCTSDSLGNTY